MFRIFIWVENLQYVVVDVEVVVVAVVVVLWVVTVVVVSFVVVVVVNVVVSLNIVDVGYAELDDWKDPVENVVWYAVG